MQTLRELSARRGHPRIRLVVADRALDAAVDLLKPLNVVRTAPAVEPCDGTLLGASGALVWNRHDVWDDSV